MNEVGGPVSAVPGCNGSTFYTEHLGACILLSEVLKELNIF